MQHLQRRAQWDLDAVRDELYGFILHHLRKPNAVLVIDEIRFRKNGHHSAGVTRQLSGVTSRAENCQIGVFLAYAGRHVQSLLDRELYVLVAWIDDRDRCRRVGIPEDRCFETKPQLVQHMLA